MSFRSAVLAVAVAVHAVDGHELVELRQKYDRKIKTFCKHEFVQDLIDIDPDRSETIEYCHKCEYTKQKN